MSPKRKRSLEKGEDIKVSIVPCATTLPCVSDAITRKAEITSHFEPNAVVGDHSVKDESENDDSVDEFACESESSEDSDGENGDSDGANNESGDDESKYYEQIRIRNKKRNETRLEKDPETCLSSEDDEVDNTYYDTYGRRHKYPTFDKMIKLTAVKTHNIRGRAQQITEYTSGILLLDLSIIIASYLLPVIPISVFWKNQDWGIYPKILTDKKVDVRISEVSKISKKNRSMLNVCKTLGGQLLQTAGDVHAFSPLIECGYMDRDRPGIMICEYSRWFMVLSAVPVWEERDYELEVSITLCNSLSDAEKVKRLSEHPDDVSSSDSENPEEIENSKDNSDDNSDEDEKDDGEEDDGEEDEEEEEGEEEEEKELNDD